MKKRLFTMFLLSLILLGMNVPSFAANHFIDVDDTAWYAEAVVYAEDTGLMLGTGRDYFEPGERVNRAMVVTSLYRLAGEPEVSGNNMFSDVDQGAWYEAAVIWAQENSIALGYDAGHFGPMDPVTREQLVMLLWRYAGEPTVESAMPFADMEEASAWAENAINWARQTQIISGVGNNRFNPKGLSDRAQLAQVFMNGVENRVLSWQEAAEEPAPEAAAEPAAESTTEPAAGSTTKPASEPASKPAAEPSTEPTTKPADDANNDEASNAEKTEPRENSSDTAAGTSSAKITEYVDKNGSTAYIPAEFKVSANEDEKTINTGLVVIGPDGSEFVWVPTTVTALSVREFGSYFSGGTIANYHDETELESYREMLASVEKYGGFYIGRFEASKGNNGLPLSKRVTKDEPGTIWVQFSPQDTVGACASLYADNDTVQGFFPWGSTWDTTLQWLIDSGCKTKAEVASDSTSWGNYSDDSFSPGARGNYTGAWEEAKANNIYDLAGNNWEWTQERCGSNYVMRGGGYNLMGGACPGSRYPAALRDPLPGNNHHPNVTFRAALYLK